MSEVTPSELYKDAFFLHSFLDEYIGSEKGNYPIATIDEFIKHSPATLCIIIEDATKYAKEIYTIIDSVFSAGIRRDKNKNTIEYTYTLGNNDVYGVHDYETIGDRKFLIKPCDYNFDYNNYISYAHNYFKMDTFYMIDINVEKKLHTDIEAIIDKAIKDSESKPVFIPIGHPKHMLGLLITNEHIVITNSGDGIVYHNTKQSSSAPIDNTQCVLYFKKPSVCILKKILKEFIQIKTLYINTTIKSVYAIIYKLYFMNLIQSDEYRDQVKKLMETVTCLINTDKDFGLIDHTCFNSLETQDNIGIVRNALWFNPYYHENVSYKLYIKKNYMMENLKKIFKDNFVSMIFEKYKMLTIVHIKENILTKYMYSFVEGIFNKINNYDKISSILSSLLFNDIAYFIKNKGFNKNNSENTKKKYFCIMHDSVETEIISEIKSGKMNSIEEINKIMENRTNLNISYNDIEQIKNCEKTKELINEKIEKRYNDILDTLFTCDDIKRIIDMLDIICIESVVSKIKDDDSYNFTNTIDAMCNNIHNDVKLETKNFSRLSYYDKTSERKQANMELFCDLLLHESIASDDSIFIVKNHKTFSDSYEFILNSEKKTPTQILLKELKKSLPQLYEKVSKRKIDALDPDSFYVRQQFSGSCTFNGTLLAMSLLWPEDIANNMIQYAGKYENQYTELKKKLQENQIATFTHMINYENYTLSTKDRLVVDALEVAYNKKTHKEKNIDDFIKLLRSKLPVQTISIVKAVLNKGNTYTHSIMDVPKKYSSIIGVTNLALESLLDMWEKVGQIVYDGDYISHCFIKFVMNPTIMWILDFEKNEKDTKKVSDTMTQIFNIIKDVIGADKRSRSLEYKPYTLALYMTGLYVLFKSMQMRKIFDEKSVDIILKMDKNTHKKRNLFKNFYLTTAIDKDAMIDLCKILYRYQFLILFDDDLLDIANIINIIPKANYIKMDSKIEMNDLTLLGDKYKSLHNIPEMKNIANIIENSILGTVREHHIEKIITIDCDYTLIKNNMIPENLVSSSDKNTRTVYQKIPPTEDNEIYICVAFEQEYIDWPLIVKINNYQNNDNSVYIPNRDDMVGKYVIINLMQDEDNFYTKNKQLYLNFSSPVKNIKVYKLKKVLKDDVQFHEKEIELKVKFLDNSRVLLKDQRVIDMRKLNHLLQNSSYDQLNKYLKDFEINELVSGNEKNETRLNPYKSNFYLPMLVNVSSEEIVKLSVTQNTIGLYKDYQFYNSHNIMEFYKVEIKKIIDDINKTSYSDEVKDIIQRLRVLSGDIDDYVRKEYTVFDQKNSLELSWGVSDEECKFTSLCTNPLARIDDGYVFYFDDNSNRKIVYYEKKDEIYINNYQMMNESKLKNKIIELVYAKKFKNAHMIENMMYYAKGIPEFVIGLDEECTSGIIAFFPKNERYYKRYFYNNPWVEMDVDWIKNRNTSIPILHNMSKSAKNFTWVEFNIDLFNSALPIMGTHIISENDTYMLSFTLFCENLLIQGKHELFGLLIPQLVNAYFMVAEYSKKDNSETIKYVHEKHRILIDYIIDKKYVISPYRYYYINKLNMFIKGSYDNKDYSAYVMRKSYYPDAYNNLDDVKELIEPISKNKFDMGLYNKWIEEYNKIMDIHNETHDQTKRYLLLNSIKKILRDIPTPLITEQLTKIKCLNNKRHEQFNSPSLIYYILKEISPHIRNAWILSIQLLHKCKNIKIFDSFKQINTRIIKNEENMLDAITKLMGKKSTKKVIINLGESTEHIANANTGLLIEFFVTLENILTEKENIIDYLEVYILESEKNNKKISRKISRKIKKIRRDDEMIYYYLRDIRDILEPFALSLPYITDQTKIIEILERGVFPDATETIINRINKAISNEEKINSFLRDMNIIIYKKYKSNSVYEIIMNGNNITKYFGELWQILYGLHPINVEKIAKYSSTLKYICDKVNFESMANSLQITTLRTIENILADPKLEENEIIGNVKYFIKKTFDVSEDEYNILNYIKLFELISGKILDEDQYEFVMQMFKDNEDQICKVYELLMGRGKTSVIIPCTLFCYMFTGSYYNIINCLPIHLVNQSMSILNKLSPFMINGVIVQAMCDRESPMNNSVKTLIDLPIRKIICIDDSSLKSYLLSNAENKEDLMDIKKDKVYNMDIDSKYDDMQTQQMKTRLKKSTPKESYSALRDNTLILLDEFDSLIDPLKSDLNYPYGIPNNLEHYTILNKLVLCITDTLFKKYSSYMYCDDRANNVINKLIIRSIMKFLIESKNEDINELRGILKKNLRTELRSNHLLKKYFAKLNGEEEKHLTELNQRGGSLQSLIMFIVREVYKTYVMCLEMLLDKDYGWDDPLENNPFIAIPYSAQKTPLKGSKFSSPIINIVLTTITYFSKSFRKIDADKFKIYIRLLVKASSSKIVIDEKKLDEDGVKYAVSDLYEPDAFLLHMNKLKNDNQPVYYNYIRVYLEELILVQYVKVDPDIYNCSFIDVIDPNFIKSKFAMSGTVNIRLPEFKYYGKNNILYEIKDDDKGETKKRIQSVLLGASNIMRLETLENPANPIQYKDDSDIGKIVNTLDKKNLYSIIKLFDTYNVLIDVGSFLRNYENHEFGLVVSEHYKDRNVVYFDANDKPVAMLNKEIIPFDMKSLKKDLKTIVIFDQKHTIGTDLDLHSLSKGIVTVNRTTAITPLVQGIYRLREIELKQEITYLTKDFPEDCTSPKLIKYIKDVEDKVYESSRIKFYEQTILCLLRRYAQYSKQSYQFKTFIPSTKLTDKIFDDYNHNYKKEVFKEYVNNYLAECDKLYIEIDQGEKKIKENIKEEITTYIEKIEGIKEDDNSIMVQKQTNIQEEKEESHQTEKVTNPNIINDRYICGLDISTVNYDVYADPVSDVMVKYSDYMLKEDPIVKIMKDNNIDMSPDAVKSICKLYVNGESDDLFYLEFIEAKDNVIKVMLYTSVDIIILFYQRPDIITKLVCVDKFATDMSKEMSTISFYQNIMMFMLFQIPSLKDMDCIEKMENIKTIAKSHIGPHYRYRFKYNIAAISKRFAKFIGCDDTTYASS